MGGQLLLEQLDHGLCGSITDEDIALGAVVLMALLASGFVSLEVRKLTLHTTDHYEKSSPICSSLACREIIEDPTVEKPPAKTCQA
jgi:hypothetical protein